MFNPMLIANAHMLGIPVNLAPCLKKARFLIKNTNKPLACMQVFNRCTTALMCPDIMLYSLLPQDLATLLQIAQYTLTSFYDCETSICSRQFRHTAVAPKCRP